MPSDQEHPTRVYRPYHRPYFRYFHGPLDRYWRPRRIFFMLSAKPMAMEREQDVHENVLRWIWGGEGSGSSIGKPVRLWRNRESRGAIETIGCQGSAVILVLLLDRYTRALRGHWVEASPPREICHELGFPRTDELVDVLVPDGTGKHFYNKWMQAWKTRGNYGEILRDLDAKYCPPVIIGDITGLACVEKM